MKRAAAPPVPSRWRAAIVGCGWIGSGVADDPRADGIQAHAAAYVACRDTELVGVCDADDGVADRVAGRWGLRKGFRRVSELLTRVRPQIVSVCTPDETHAAVLREIFDDTEVRAVVAEKPLALDLAEARSLVELADRRGIVLAVNYSRRFAPSHIDAQRRVAAGEIGKVLAVQGSYTKGILHNGSHWFDLARWLVGRIDRIHAWPGATDPQQTDPTCHARVHFADGQTGFLLGLDKERYTIFEMDLLGTLGRLRISDSGMRFSWFKVGESPYYSGYRTLASPGEVTAGFQDIALRMVEDTVDALRRGTKPRCTGEDGLAALSAADAARRSLATGAECAVE